MTSRCVSGRGRGQPGIERYALAEFYPCRLYGEPFDLDLGLACGADERQRAGIALLDQRPQRMAHDPCRVLVGKIPAGHALDQQIGMILADVVQVVGD